MNANLTMSGHLQWISLKPEKALRGSLLGRCVHLRPCQLPTTYTSWQNTNLLSRRQLIVHLTLPLEKNVIEIDHPFLCKISV